MYFIKILSGVAIVALVVLPFKYLYRQPGTEQSRSQTGKCYVWPDPVKDVMHVRTPFVNGTIEIVDAAGRVLLKKPITAITTDIYVVQLKNGIYFVRIKYSNNKQQVVRVVKV